MLHAVKARICTYEIQVFSAPNYVDQSGNKGAFVSIGCSIYVTFTMTDNSFCRFELTIWDTESMCNLMPHLIPPWSRWHMCKVALEVFSCKGCIYNVYMLHTEMLFAVSHLRENFGWPKLFESACEIFPSSDSSCTGFSRWIKPSLSWPLSLITMRKNPHSQCDGPSYLPVVIHLPTSPIH